MADFKKAFEEGQVKASLAASNAVEIDLVFDELNNALKDATNNAIYLHRRRLRSLVANEHMGELAITRVADNSSARIARWFQEDIGYPCRLKYGEHDISCFEKATLEEQLAFLLRDERTAKIIYDMLNSNEEEDPGDERVSATS